jgi:tetratricopeptide (TPR) repeat protein
VLEATAFSLAVLLAPGARADGGGDAVSAAHEELVRVSHSIPSIQSEVARARAGRPTVEQRLADGELLYRLHDVGRAVVVFSEILEAYPDTPSYADALWLRGETFFSAHDYLAARRDYQTLVDHGSEARFRAYFGKAVARLVDVALSLNEPPDILAAILQRISSVPADQMDAGLLYAEGKGNYFRGLFDDAARAFARVGRATPYAHQAGYFQGLISLKAARARRSGEAAGRKAESTTGGFKAAIEAFRAVTELPPDTPEHRHVIDLAWMAIGRLFYESDQYRAATAAYSKVGRDSPEFDAMLYELAWVYVALGDVTRAERALEVLMVSDPDSQFIADGTLLRADLLLRAGSFDRALTLYETVRKDYEPMRARMDAFMASAKGVGAYYDKMADLSGDALDEAAKLPPLAVRWAREGEDGATAFAVVDDVAECAKLIAGASQLVARLSALMGASTRVRAFSELQAGEESGLSLLNRLSRARLAIARALDAEEPHDLNGAAGEARVRRRTSMAWVEGLPVTPDDFAQREQQGLAQWNSLSQELTRRSMEIDSLHAAINGLHRMLTDGPQQGIARDPSSVARFQAELDVDERDLKHYSELVSELRRSIDLGRSQIGLGDARFQNDALARDQFRDALEEEVRLTSGGEAGPSAARISGPARTVLAEARQLEATIGSLVQALEAQVQDRAGELQRKIDSERALIAGYQRRLDVLDGEARDLVGHVAERNFGLVRDKLKGIVLRADVGVTEQAWEVRQEESDRVQSLLSERGRQQRLLDDELKEVKDDGVEPGQGAP